MRRLAPLFVVVLVGAGVVHAQDAGQIFGRVTDSSGAVLPGVTVTLSSPGLLQPLVAVTSETGSYQFPGLAIGVYSVRFELPGFRTLLREQIRIEIGFNAQINAQLNIASLEQVLVVVGVSPVVDLRSTTQGMHFNAEALKAIPMNRDQFHMMEQTPGIMVDRQNVGGTTSGLTTNFVARGANFNQVKWHVDGVDVTDAGNGSPWYFDFDSFAEVQVNLGGADVTMQTPGANINIVTKSGTERFKGSGRAFMSDNKFQSINVTDELRRQGASSGNPLVNVKDYGGELGGPIKRGRAWFWGGYGRNDVKVGVSNLYKTTAECAPIAANSLGYPVDRAQGCLEIYPITLAHINYKIGVQLFKGNQFTLRNTYGMQEEPLRSANDLTPPEATIHGQPVRDTAYGKRFWDTGWSPTWKFADQHIFSDRWMVELGYSHFTKNTLRGRHHPSLATVQPMFEISSGHRARSGSHGLTVQPHDSLTLTTNYFLPGKWGGDHSIKAGYEYDKYENYTEAAPAGGNGGGNVIASFNSGATLPRFSVPFSAQLYRNSITDPFLYEHSAYVQDTYTHKRLKRLTLNLGFRWDRQDDRQAPVRVPASPFQGQVTANGAVFDLLPAVNFPGAEGGVIWNTVAPRLGVTYDLTGNGKTVLKAAFAQYYDQRQVGQLSQTLNTIGSSFVELPWQDLNGDKSVQANEIDTRRLLSFGGQYNPADPAQTVSPNRIDSNIKDPRTNEIVVGIDRELAADFGVSVSYIWRTYTDFIWQQRIGLSSSDYSRVTFTPSANACPLGARCETVTYFVPNFPLPSPYVLTNQPDYNRKYQSLEAIVRKRLSNRWMMTGSYAYNDTRAFYTSPAAYQDPTNINMFNGAQYAPETAASSLSNVFLNAKHMLRFAGSYRLWRDIGVAGSYDARQGYPFVPSINISSRPNQAGGIAVLLDPLGDVRLPTFQTLDFRVDRTFTFGRVSLHPALDIFNVFNGNTILSRRRNQNASNANQVNATLAPRVARIGFVLSF